MAACRKAASALPKAEKVFFYGSIPEIYMFSDLMHTFLHLGIQPVILDDWPIAQIRKKLAGASPDDVLFFVEPGYSLQMMQIRMSLYEEVIQYGELSAFAGTKIFIGRKSAESDGFGTIEIPQSADTAVYLKQISQCLIERMWLTQ
jgi:hypothetical protein